MNTKPYVNLFIETEALQQALAPATTTEMESAVRELIQYVQSRSTAEITWLDAAEAVTIPSWTNGHKRIQLTKGLPPLGKGAIMLANHPDLVAAALNNDTLLVTINHTVDDSTAYEMHTPADLVFLQKLLTPLPAGKVPNELLANFLGEITFDDPDLLINPGIGEDTAAVDITSAQIMVLKADPITFASNSISQYAVLVNANDIATAGARPRWFMTTLLFPRGTTGLTIRHIILELSQYCRKWDICLAGGHTEITDAVTRPVVIGMMSGLVPKDKLLNKKNIATGDVMILTKAVAVEGTALIAKEMALALLAGGMSTAEIHKCAGFLELISILPEAGIAMQHEGVIAMHDVTEGGLATAAPEMAVAAGLGLNVNMDAIPIYPETRKLCNILSINPLGLISSGCLLIACKPDMTDALLDKLAQADIQATAIAVFTEEHPGVARPQNPAHVWPSFEVDEIARVTQNLE